MMVCVVYNWILSNAATVNVETLCFSSHLNAGEAAVVINARCRTVYSEKTGETFL